MVLHTCCRRYRRLTCRTGESIRIFSCMCLSSQKSAIAMVYKSKSSSRKQTQPKKLKQKLEINKISLVKVSFFLNIRRHLQPNGLKSSEAIVCITYTNACRLQVLSIKSLMSPRDVE